jgi:hypothetical protein
VEIRRLDLGRDFEHYVDVLGLHLSGKEWKTAYLKGGTSAIRTRGHTGPHECSGSGGIVHKWR